MNNEQKSLAPLSAADRADPFQLNLRHLRRFLTACDLGSISAAASTLGTSQPALTQAVLKLEIQLNQRLFERRPRGLEVTAAGKLVHDRVSSAFAHLEEGVRAAAGNQLGFERRLSMTHMRAFLALADCTSIVAAARHTRLSSPAIHRAIRDLEAALGKPLVERRGQGVGVNASGRRFARKCRLAVSEIEAALSDLGLRPGEPTITLGTTPFARAFLVPEAMAALNAHGYPAGFKVLEGSWDELVETLRDGLIDLVVGEIPSRDAPDLALNALHQEPIVIVAGRQHPLAKKRNVTVATLASYGWIVGSQSSPLRSVWERLFEGQRPQAPIECGSIMVIGRLLTSSDLLTLATPDQVALQIRSGLLARIGSPLKDRHTIGTTIRKGWRPTAAQAHFLKELSRVSASMNSAEPRKALVEEKWV